MKIFPPLSSAQPFSSFEGSEKRKAPVGLNSAFVISQVLMKWRTESQKPFLTLLNFWKDYTVLFCLGKTSHAQAVEASLGKLQLHGNKCIIA